MTIIKLTKYSMTSVDHHANNKLDSHTSKPIAVIINFISFTIKGRTEVPLPEITCLDIGLLSFVKVVLKSVTV